MRCKFLGSFFLLFSLSSKGADCRDSGTVWGALGHDINLNIPDFQITDDIDEVRWMKGSTLVAQFHRKMKPFLKPGAFEILTNGTLKIKNLTRDDSDTYTLTVYGTNGTVWLNKALDLRILEIVSKPTIHWECSNTTLTCEVTEGTDVELKLYQGKQHLKSLRQKTMVYQWTNLRAPFKCKAVNKVSQESEMEAVNCPDKGLSLYLIVGGSAGGLLLVFLGALFIFCMCKRKKRNRRKDEELEITASRMSTVERTPKPHPPQAVTSALQNPVPSQAPPPPGHHLQTPGHRPLPPSHRSREHQQKKRPPPSGTQVHQQKGPPLPRPRVQPKPPSGTGDVSVPPPN